MSAWKFFSNTVLWMVVVWTFIKYLLSRNNCLFRNQELHTCRYSQQQTERTGSFKVRKLHLSFGFFTQLNFFHCFFHGFFKSCHLILFKYIVIIFYNAKFIVLHPSGNKQLPFWKLVRQTAIFRNQIREKTLCYRST